MSQRDPRRSPPALPGRPRFEFRQRRSEVVARRARTFDIVVGLWTAAAVLVLASALVLLLDLDATQSAVRAIVDRDFPDESAVVRDRVVAATVAVLVGGGLVVALGTGAAAAAMRAGRGGWRFVLVLLLLADVVLIVLSAGVVAPLVVGLLMMAAALGLAATLAMCRPAAGRWFTTRR